MVPKTLGCKEDLDPAQIENPLQDSKELPFDAELEDDDRYYTLQELEEMEDEL